MDLDYKAIITFVVGVGFFICGVMLKMEMGDPAKIASLILVGIGTLFALPSLIVLCFTNLSDLFEKSSSEDAKWNRY